MSWSQSWSRVGDGFVTSLLCLRLEIHTQKELWPPPLVDFLASLAITCMWKGRKVSTSRVGATKWEVLFFNVMVLTEFSHNFSWFTFCRKLGLCVCFGLTKTWSLGGPVLVQTLWNMWDNEQQKASHILTCRLCLFHYCSGEMINNLLSLLVAFHCTFTFTFFLMPNSVKC